MRCPVQLVSYDYVLDVNAKDTSRQVFVETDALISHLSVVIVCTRFGENDDNKNTMTNDGSGGWRDGEK